MSMRPILPADARRKEVPPPDEAKKPLTLKSCDRCRRRKIRCKSSFQMATAMTNRIASAQLASRCKWNALTQRRESNLVRVYKSSRDTHRELEEYLHKRFPEVDLAEELGPFTMQPLRLLSSITSTAELDEDAEQQPPNDFDDFVVTHLTDPPRWGAEKGFLGKSSVYPLIRDTHNARDEVTGKRTHQRHFILRSDVWITPSVRNPAHWLMITQSPTLPPPDRLKLLVKAFFQTSNAFFPLLHQGLFEQQLNSEECMKDAAFIAVVLMVSAMGEMLLLFQSASSEPPTNHAPGWEYFEQIAPFLRVPTPIAPRLHDVHIFILATIYVSHTKVQGPTTAWSLLGVGIRMIFEVGAHHFKAYKETPNLIDELWKRAFWLMLVLDRRMSASLGRPSAVHDESYDLSLPLEVDDDCWDMSNPAQHFPLQHPQPVDRPCHLQHFVSSIRLYLISGIAQRTKLIEDVMIGITGGNWGQEAEERLEKSLQEWTTKIPEHLKWNPQSAIPFFYQSASIYTEYYALQILVHNPFTSQQGISVRLDPRNIRPNSNRTFTKSFAICTNAAQACASIFAVQIERGGDRPFIMPQQLQAAFTSALVLLVHMFGSGARLKPAEAVQIMGAVRTCMDVMALVEKSWPFAGQPWDVINELARDLEYPLPPSLLPEDGSSNNTSPNPTYIESPVESQPGIVAGTSASVQYDMPQTAGQQSTSFGLSPAAFPGGLPYDTTALEHMPFLPPTAPDALLDNGLDTYTSFTFDDLPLNLQLMLCNDILAGQPPALHPLSNDFSTERSAPLPTGSSFDYS
ncbi:fungal-specific transcription factor domain-containing protein [Auriculariales sp. MPI-PUGE-AT-0066]|nr:fungal-specific transcription factor domain-containing protein [Auriculariales sp. MPI-PUGE-AT-0066]